MDRALELLRQLDDVDNNVTRCREAVYVADGKGTWDSVEGDLKRLKSAVNRPLAEVAALKSGAIRHQLRPFGVDLVDLPDGLTELQVEVLSRLTERDHVGRQLAMGILGAGANRAPMWEALANLEERGLIEREGAGPEGICCITEAGRYALDVANGEGNDADETPAEPEPVPVGADENDPFQDE